MLDSSEGEGSRASLGRADEGVCPHVDCGETGSGVRIERLDHDNYERADERTISQGDNAASDSAGTRYVCVGATLASLFSFLIFYRRGDILLFGDAVAHINIARRVFDSRTPGPLQLGTVWLPLPHVLMMPFIMSRWMWRTGVGASIPSMIAFVFSVVGIFRLVRGAMAAAGQSVAQARRVAVLAAAVFGLNPNLLYLQATAMTESLYLALFIWAVVYFSEFSRASACKDESSAKRWASSLHKCGFCLLGACLTRYDGWLVAAVMAVLVCFVIPRLASKERTRTWGTIWRQSPATSNSPASDPEAPTRIAAKDRPRSVRRQVVIFLLLASAGPVVWLAYNAVVYKNALEFANGPYSAKAIERRTAVPGFPPHPGAGNPGIAALYFMKAGESNVAEAGWQRTWLWFGLLGAGWLLLRGRRAVTLFLLWLPVPFYMLSVAYGSVPIYTPAWWPFSLYNVRYGVQLLPAFAVFLSVAAACVISLMVTETGKRMIAILMVGLVAISYAGVWVTGPVAYREAWVNSRSRLQLQHQLAEKLKRLPRGASFLMYLGEHVGALQDAGIPLRRAISEGNHRVWVQPSDPEGLWERSLADPAKYADFVVASEEDPVWQAVHDRNLPEIARIDVEGQRTVHVWRAR
jgi:hypothetical protein